jgi:hypothetical protein
VSAFISGHSFLFLSSFHSSSYSLSFHFGIPSLFPYFLPSYIFPVPLLILLLYFISFHLSSLPNSLIVVPSSGFHHRALYRQVKHTKLSTPSQWTFASVSPLPTESSGNTANNEEHMYLVWQTQQGTC